MGSFAYTCAVSGLPIEAGDNVKIFLLSENPYNEGCYIHGQWQIRTWPLNAKYNDYGSAESVTSGPRQQAWLDGFKLDLHERCWGNNKCHDIPVLKNGTFQDLLNALSEDRLLVEHDVHINGFAELDNRDYDSLLPLSLLNKEEVKGVPTVDRIEKILLSNGYKKYSGMFEDDRVIVSEEKRGEITVRISTFGSNIDTLNKCALLFDEYAVMVSSSPNDQASELLIRPKAGTKDFYGHRPFVRPPCKVKMAMVREDVWDGLAKINPESFMNEANNFAHFRTKAQSVWDKYTNLLNNRSATSTGYDIIAMYMDYDSFLIGKDALPSFQGTGTAFKLVANRYKQMTDKQISDFLDEVAKMCVVSLTLSTVRYSWRPSTSTGPQFGEWRRHLEFFNTLINLTKIKADEEQAQADENKAWEDNYLKEQAAKEAAKAKRAKNKAKKVKSKKR